MGDEAFSYLPLEVKKLNFSHGSCRHETFYAFCLLFASLPNHLFFLGVLPAVRCNLYPALKRDKGFPLPSARSISVHCKIFIHRHYRENENLLNYIVDVQ